jgi:hypothetical protein
MLIILTSIITALLLLFVAAAFIIKDYKLTFQEILGKYDLQ